MALENNNQVRSSREQVNQARQDVRIATSPLLPQVNAEGRYIKEKETDSSASGQGAIFGDFFGSQPDEYGQLTLSASQHLYQGGKRWSQRQASQLSLQGERKRHFRQLQSILFNVATRYYEVLLANQNIVIAENQITRTKRQLERAQQRLEVGLVNKTAVLRAEVQVARAREQLERAKNQRAVAMENLRLEMGVDEIPNTLKEIPEEKLEEISREEFRQRGLDNRRDLQQLAKGRQAAGQRLESEQGDFWPELSLQGTYNRADEAIYTGSERDDWRVSLVASYDLFTGFRDMAEVSKARRNEAQLGADYQRLRRSISAEIRSVYLDLKTQEKVIESLKEEVDSATANYEQIVAQFNEGLASSVDVVDAQTALNEAERRLSLAYYNYQLNLLRLELATGTFEQARVGEFIQPASQTQPGEPKEAAQ
jgi:outer membrane protein